MHTGSCVLVNAWPSAGTHISNYNCISVRYIYVMNFYTDSLLELLLQNCDSFVLIIIILAVYLLVLALRRMQEIVDLPPGPMPLPIIGNLHQLGSKPHERLTEFTQRFGDVYTLQLGSRRAIVLNSLTYVKEALVKKSSDYSSRPPLPSFKMNDLDGRSIAFGPYGPTYLKNHRLGFLAIHSFLSDHEHFSELIAEGVKTLCQKFAAHKREFDPTFDIKNTIAEMNFGYTFGEDIDEKDKNSLGELLDEASEFVQNNKYANLVDFIPWTSLFFMGSVRRIREIVENLSNFVRKIYREKREKFINKGKVRCVADALVRCYETGTNERIVALGEELDLDEENIVTVLTDIFGASVETTSTSLCWAVLHLAANPTVQERLHKELTDVIGEGGIAITYKRQLPLLEATVLETLRLSTVLPLAIPHYAENETSVGQYRVPSGTIVLINLWGINHDERVFKDPFAFDPDRFIDELGNVNKTRFASLPFSTGTRKCLGHTLAQQQLMLVVGGLVQKYRFEVHGNPNFSPVFGFVLRPQPFKITIIPRS